MGKPGRIAMRAQARALAGFLVLAAGAALAGSAAAEPVRVAALLPFVGEAVELVPGKATLVAAARRDLRTPLPEGVVDLGNPHSPNLEALAGARPGVVVAEKMLHARMEPDLAAGGAKVLLIDTTSVESTLAGLVELGKLVGDEKPIAARADALRAEIAKHRLAKPVPVLPLFGTPDSFYVVTKQTWLGDLLVQLGFELPATSAPGDKRFPGFVPVSDEFLVTLRPELVLLVAHGDPKALEETLVRKTSEGGPWSSVGKAAKLGVRVLDPRVFGSNPGLGMGKAAEGLAALVAAEETTAKAAPAAETAKP
jgi:iron complex transport system substrate-binding protein